MRGGLHPGAADTTAARAAKRTVAVETIVSVEGVLGEQVRICRAKRTVDLPK